MKSQNASRMSKSGQTRFFGLPSTVLFPRVAAFMILAALIASSFYVASSAASWNRDSMKAGTAVSLGVAASANRVVGSVLSSRLMAKYAPSSTSPLFSSPSVATFAADCTTPKTVFHVSDTVCATVSGATPGWQLIWSDPNSNAVQTDTITSDPQNISLALSSTATRGSWRVIVYDPFGVVVYAVAGFTVTDPQNPVVDVQASKSAKSNGTSAGAQVVFSIQVGNAGPDKATNVQLTDAVPANTTFVSFSQLSGPVFTCTNPSSGATGSTVCTVPALNIGDTATFVATYLVDGGVSAGSTIDNTATISSSVADSNTANNSSTASLTVMSSPCVLTCPSNITQNADPGQAGAVVTYSNPTHTGACGQDTVDPETGITVPAISCDHPSGSFFDLGSTAVICSSVTGTSCTFQVTIQNAGNGLTITLNGANPFTLECGADFVDPGATARSNTNPNVPVTVSGSVNSHQPGSYTLTYSATDGGNSVSTTRTVNVGDTAAPVITLSGANPMNVSCGDTFTDPGASANDSCEGAEPVTSDASTVNPNVPGTYTITYTASDKLNHTTTATRTVNVQSSQPSTTTPADQTVCQGATATFSTTTSGTGPFSYAWTVDSSAFGGNTSSISVPTASLSVGNHPVSVRVSSACGSTTKQAMLTVQAKTSSTGPANQTVCQGATASFSTTASGTGPFSYAWTVDGSAFGGNTSSISVPTGSLIVGNHPVSVTVTGTCGNVTNNAALTVQENTSTTTPADQTVCQGATASFSTTASGTGPFSYAWTVDGSAFGGNTSSISVPTGSLTVGSHTVSVTVSGTCGSDTKRATLTVQENTSTTTPADQTVCQGTAANFSTTASGTGPFSYAWKVDGSATGGNSSSVSVATAALSVGSHTVSVTVTGTCGSATKNATLTVQANTAATKPTDQTVCQGATASFSTTASGTGPFSYAWAVDGSAFGGNTASISVPTGSMTVGNHTVSVTVSGTCGNATQSATLTVQPNTAATKPNDQAVCQGATGSFSTTASGTGPFSYAWTVDGSAFGGNTASISVPTGSMSVGNHSVSVTVTGTCGSATQSATLTVQANTATTKPNDQTVCQGSTASFSTTASGTGPFTFAWKKGATVLHTGDFGGRVTITSGSTTSTLTIGNSQPGDAGSYTVETTGTCGTAAQSANLAVDSTPPAVTFNSLTIFFNNVTIIFNANTVTINGVTRPFNGVTFTDDDGRTYTFNGQTVSITISGRTYTYTLDGKTLVLWTPTHQYQTVKVADLIFGASDGCDPSVNRDKVVISQVTSDEVDSGPGSDTTVNDIVIASDCKSANLRAERDPGGDGRVYTITFRVRNSAGITTTVTSKLKIFNQTFTVVDSGPHYTVNGTCP
jgi:uncharacterized repeat protein (TIGR01451 family)